MNSAAITFLRLLVIFIVCIEVNYAATKVLYEFRIRGANTQRNETGELKNSNNNSTAEELVITGSRSTSVLIMNPKPNGTNCLYKEIAEYTADDNGYRVKYNYSLVPVELGTRLNANTLKAQAG